MGPPRTRAPLTLPRSALPEAVHEQVEDAAGLLLAIGALRRTQIAPSARSTSSARASPRTAPAAPTRTSSGSVSRALTRAANSESEAVINCSAPPMPHLVAV